MKAEKIVIMFLSYLLVVGCQTAEKNTLLRTSDQMDSSQGTALPAEPIEKDPTQIDQGAVESNKKKSSHRWYVDRRRGVNPETTPAMGPNSVN